MNRRSRSVKRIALTLGALTASSVLLLQARVAAAQQARPAAPANSERALLPRVGITDERAITLADAIAQALKNNPDLAMAQIVSEQAADTIAAANGAFDPQLSVQSSFQRQETPVSSLIGGAASGRLTQQGLLVEPDFRGVLRNTGTKYQVDFTSRRQTTDNQFATLNPQFPSQLSLTVTQPLVRGMRIDESRRQVDRAKQNATLSESQLRQQMMEVALRTELAYWELYFAEQNLQIQVQGRDLGRDQVASNQRLAGQGLAAPIDVLEAETQVATFNQRIFTAQAALTRAENALKILIAPDRQAAIWASALHAATPPADDLAIASLEEALTAARTNRPELAQAAIAASTQQGETQFLSDQRKPQIDLVGTYLSSGLAGRLIQGGSNPLSFGTQPLIDRINALSGLQGLPPLAGFSTGASSISPALTGGFGRSLSNLAGMDFPTVEVGVRIALPFNNRTADARYASAVAEGRRLRLQTERLEMAVEADVRDALQAVESARAARDAALQARMLAEAQYASEQRRFEAGTSTVFLVLQRQMAMIGTRTESARAETDVNRSTAQLRRATGRILDARVQP